MRQGEKHMLTAAVIGLCWLVVFLWMAVSGAAFAGGGASLRQAALQKACIGQGGRFEQSWSYNNRDMRWSKVLICDTDSGYVTCQDRICRAGRWVSDNAGTAALRLPDNRDGAVPFPSEPEVFSAALDALTKR